jgi:hypothetical protein
MCITPVMGPEGAIFLWTVPNLPTNAAVLDIRLGCEGWYPENYAPQTRVDVYHRNEYGAVVLNLPARSRGLISTSRRQLAEAFAYENNHLLISRVPLSVGC